MMGLTEIFGALPLTKGFALIGRVKSAYSLSLVQCARICTLNLPSHKPED